ncbi:MAG: glycoside hydrolase family 66 protein [Pleomorphochaeta sp.]
MIKEFYLNKSKYNRSDEIELTIDSNVIDKTALITIFNLDKQIREIKKTLCFGINKINLGIFDYDFSGFIFTIRIDDYEINSSFSIDTNDKIIRYGFLSDFEKVDNNDDINWMRDNHISFVQYYDWSYHHDDMVSNAKSYVDSMGKRNNLDIISNKISYCKSLGMKNMAYGPIYAATKDYFLNHKEEAYYAIKDKPLSFIDTFYFMNIGESSYWRSHIISEYKKSINQVGFDGIHLDTYGYPKKALDYNNEVIELGREIPKFLDNVEESLNNAKLIFNNVGAWPLTRECARSQTAIYIEVWPPFDTFYNLKEIILKAKEFNKPIILAAYIASFRLDRENALYSALFTTFYINSLGATHLFLGEEGCVITQGYYCDYTKLRDEEKKIVKRYQDFFVAYQSLLYDDSFVDVTMTYSGWDNEEYIIEGNYSLTSESNNISVIIRENKNKHLISLMNLENNDNVWHLGKKEPSLSSSLIFKVQIYSDVKKVLFLDPEDSKLLPTFLDYEIREGARSKVIEFEVPKFKVGALVYFIEEN